MDKYFDSRTKEKKGGRGHCSKLSRKVDVERNEALWGVQAEVGRTSLGICLIETASILAVRGESCKRERIKRKKGGAATS